LQRSFEAEPGNPQRLTDLLRALNHLDPQQAIRLFESQEPRAAFTNRDAVREYIRALVLANRLDYVDLDLLLGTHWREVQQGGGGNVYAYQAAFPGGGVFGAGPTAHAAGAAAATAAKGGANPAGVGVVEMRMPASAEPLKVQIADSHRRAFWRLFRSSVTMLIMVAGVSVFAEGLAGNVQKGFGTGNKKVTPVEDVNTTFEDVKGCDEV
jgi:hypothetical protein